jgi:hypothetical protein
MSELFIYDSHYQVEKPLALLDLTIVTSSPTAHASDDTMARRLTANARKHKIQADGELVDWKVNDDQMRYWLGNCHSCELLSRQNSYDYWLMNFVWAAAFPTNRKYWGELEPDNADFVRLLLFRWAWLFDAPLVVGVAKKIQQLGVCDVGALVSMSKNAHHVEDIFVAAFSAARELSSSVRERSAYRAKRDEIKRGFKYNTRRHKVCTHFALLVESGLIIKSEAGDRKLHPGLSRVLESYDSLEEAVAATMRSGPWGRGTSFFCEIVQQSFGYKPQIADELDDKHWSKLLPEIRRYGAQVQKWDRKFLGIRALSELFLVKSLTSGTEAAPAKSWQSYLSRRASAAPEEITVHVDRFGRAEFLKLG